MIPRTNISLKDLKEKKKDKEIYPGLNKALEEGNLFFFLVEETKKKKEKE